MQVVKEKSIIDEYTISMRREINPSEKYEALTRFVLGKLDVNTATRSDIAFESVDNEYVSLKRGRPLTLEKIQAMLW